MADSFNKKEREKKKRKKKKEKAEKREQKRIHGSNSQTEEFMYLDEDGNLSPTPPDPAKKRKIKAEDIDVSPPKQEKSDQPNFQRTGIVKFFDTEKGYGFIEDKDTRESFFVHVNSLVDEISENDKVVFEAGKGPKGPVAVDVKVLD